MSQEQTDRSAINAAVATPWADQSMSGAAMRALQGGATPKRAMELAQMGEVLAQTQQRASNANQPPWDASVGVSDGQRFLRTSPNSAVPLHDSATKPEFPRVIDIGGIPHTQISPSQFVKPNGDLLSSTGERPLTSGTVSAHVMADRIISDTQKYLTENPKAGLLQRQASYDADVLQRKATANAAALAIGEKPPYPEAMREKGVKQPNLTGRPGPQASPASSRFKIVPE